MVEEVEEERHDLWMVEEAEEERHVERDLWMLEEVEEGRVMVSHNCSYGGSSLIREHARISLIDLAVVV